MDSPIAQLMMFDSRDDEIVAIFICVPVTL